MTVSDYLKCFFFFTIAALSSVFDVASINHMDLSQMKWDQLGAPIFILSAAKAGVIALLAYLMKSPVPMAGSWWKEDPVTGEWTKEDQASTHQVDDGSAPADVEAASVSGKRKYIVDLKE